MTPDTLFDFFFAGAGALSAVMIGLNWKNRSKGHYSIVGMVLCAIALGLCVWALVL